MIGKIVEKEWVMFGNVNNVSGRASCQDDYETFHIMRESQLEAWSDEMLESYLDDLKQAEANGVNLLAEKYGYMMEYTSPIEFKQIRARLSPVTEAKKALIKEIVPVHVRWLEELAREFPKLTGNGRPIRAQQDSWRGVSFETYLTGELCTYSERTLRAYQKHLKEVEQNGGNMNRTVLEHTVKKYGYDSLMRAEQKAR